jgi:hypothetical protein
MNHIFDNCYDGILSRETVIIKYLLKRSDHKPILKLIPNPLSSLRL